MELEPCPFCGHTDIREMAGVREDRGWVMLCGGCGIRQGSAGRTKEAAIAAWNRRTTATKGDEELCRLITDELRKADEAHALEKLSDVARAILPIVRANQTTTPSELPVAGLVEDVRATLQHAKNQFYRYAELHRAKQTDDGDEKACTNAGMGEEMADGLTALDALAAALTAQAQRIAELEAAMDRCATASQSDEALVEQLAYHIIEGSAGIRAAEHAKDFCTANWEDGLRSARAILPILRREQAKLSAQLTEAKAGIDYYAGLYAKRCGDLLEAKADAEAANQRAAFAEHRLYSFRQGRAARSKATADFIKSRAPELWADYAALSVNGSLYSDELTIEPVYEREMNTLRHRAETAEERAIAAKADAERLAEALSLIRHQWAGHAETCAFVQDYDNKCDCDWGKIAAKCDAALASYREKHNG